MSDLRSEVADLRYRFAAYPGEGADGDGPMGQLMDAVLALIPEGAVLVTGAGDESITIDGHLYVHVAACPCPEMQAEVARLEAQWHDNPIEEEEAE